MASNDIQRVIALMEKHGIGAFDYEQGSIAIRLTRGSAGAISAGTERPESQNAPTALIRSPCVGHVLHAHPASATGPAPLPRAAAKGDVVAYIRTGTTLRAVIAERDCLLQRAVASEGEGVGYADPLFEIAS